MDQGGDSKLRVCYNGERVPVQLQMRSDSLMLQREELAYTHSPTNHVDSAILARERVVHLKREKIGGLGLSVKGGSEHNLPILVSRIFKDQAADKTGQLFVGDAILQVNGVTMENNCHDDAVKVLKNSGDDVKLTVKYFQSASMFLNKGTIRKNSKSLVDNEDNNRWTNSLSNNNCTEPERQWSDLLSVSLLCAYVTRFKPGSDEMCAAGFEVIGTEGQTTGLIECEDEQTLQDLMHNINIHIRSLNNQSICLTNKLLLPSEQIVDMCWVCEKVGVSKLYQTWKRQLLAFKGQEVCFFESAPLQACDWAKCDHSYKIHECMFKTEKEGEVLDSRPHCFTLETGDGESVCLSVESRQELLLLEKSWYRATYLAVKHLRSKTFGCTWRGHLSGITLDLSTGFSLYDSNDKTFMWTYRFSQLKASSDDGESRLKLTFQNDVTSQLETREVECTSLKSLLYSIHAFLSAKLASVDPSFLFNL